MKAGRFLLLAGCTFALSAAQTGTTEIEAKKLDRALARTPKSSALWTRVARFRLETGDAGGAIAAADYAARLDPANPRAALMVAQLARGQYGPVASRPLFDRALSLQPDNLETLGEMAATLAEAGQARAMLTMTRRMLALDRSNPRAFFLQAVISARAGKYVLARGLLYRTGGRLDAQPAVALLDAALELEAGNSEQAIAGLKDLVRGRPLHFPARRLLASAQWQAGDMAGVVQTLAPMARRADADAYTLTLIGRAFEAQGDRVAAAQMLDRAAFAAPGEATSFGLSDWAGSDPANADVAIPRISQLVAGGNFGAAIALASKIRDSNRGSPGADVALGDVLIAAGQSGEAAQAYRSAANLDFSEPIALRLISALQRAGQGKAAADAASLYLQQNPRSIPALRLAANATMVQNDWPHASALFDMLRVRLGSRDAGATVNGAWARLASGKAASAKVLARRSVMLAPNNAQILGASGWIIGKAGDKSAGRALLTKARTLAPGDETIRTRLEQLVAG